MSYHDEMQVATEVIEYLSTDHMVLLKPHPREREGKYEPLLKRYTDRQFLLLDKSVPIEKILCRAKPELVAGYTSTALITAGSLFDIPAYTLCDHIMPYISEQKFRHSLKEFKAMSRNYVQDFSVLKNR